MRILIIMAGFFPGKKYGGPPVSIDNFCTLLNNQECYIVTKNHDKGELEEYSRIEEGWNNRGNCRVIYLSDSLYKKRTFEKIILDIQPDILYLQGLFQTCVFPCLQLARKHGIAVLLAPRGELCSGALKIKAVKKKIYISIVKLLKLVNRVHFQSTSEEETVAIEKWLNVNNARIHSLSNIPSIPKKSFIRRKKNVGEGYFIFLSRIHPKKNVLAAIKYFQNVTGKVYFDIYGPIEDEVYWSECKQAIRNLPSNISVAYKGLVDHEQVHEVFSRYDAFLFPTLSENFGHVIAESLAVGTPVIVSDQTPWLDMEKYDAGWAIPLKKTDEFVFVIEHIIKANQIEDNKVIAYFEMKTKIQQLRMEYEMTIAMIAHEKNDSKNN